MTAPSMRARASWGVIAVLVYVLVARATFRFGSVEERPLFDGVHGAPPPYAWVTPPADLADGNVPAAMGTSTIALTKSGSAPGDVATTDNQAIIILPEGSFQRRAGEKEVVVTIQPLDPGALAPPPPGMEYQGNAYRFHASYGTSGEPVPQQDVSCEPVDGISLCATILLRSPFGATGIWRLSDAGSWVEIDATESGFDIFGESPLLGTFVAAAPPGARGSGPQSSGAPMWIPIAAGIVALVVAGVLARVRSSYQREKRLRVAQGKRYRPPPKRAGKRARR